ncbi:molybdenum cofactor biosynthesis protein MoaE [Candidatus Methylocalor cossyra]|uniref:Molybdopterin synthase catalytic subunit n=1 Tax=Candidatus Methylocalor cossyra TaxID=3108543 RepID=A0ABM9NKX2_9GAMM
MATELRGEDFSPYDELERYQQERLGQAGQYGASCVFVGTLRDHNEGERVLAMQLEHYPGMTEKHLARIVEEAGRRSDFLDALVIHRIGQVFPGQPIVLVAVWAPHRGAAFDACRYIIEELKHRAPFWKKETLEQGERWVERNSPG